MFWLTANQYACVRAHNGADRIYASHENRAPYVFFLPFWFIGKTQNHCISWHDSHGRTGIMYIHIVRAIRRKCLTTTAQCKSNPRHAVGGQPATQVFLNHPHVIGTACDPIPQVFLSGHSPAWVLKCLSKMKEVSTTAVWRISANDGQSKFPNPKLQGNYPLVHQGWLISPHILPALSQWQVHCLTLSNPSQWR